MVEARSLTGRETPVIVDGSFYYRSQFDGLVHRMDLSHAVFTLKAPLSVCIERDRQRPGSLAEDRARKVFAKVAEVEYGVVVDTRKLVREVVRELVGYLRRLPSWEGSCLTRLTRDGLATVWLQSSCAALDV